MLKEVLLHPYVTEKSLNHLTGTPQQDNHDGNRLEFIVRREAAKQEIKEAFEHMFDVKVKKVRTRIAKDGKHAIIELTSEYSADDIGTRIGIFS